MYASVYMYCDQHLMYIRTFFYMDTLRPANFNVILLLCYRDRSLVEVKLYWTTREVTVLVKQATCFTIISN